MFKMVMDLVALLSLRGYNLAPIDHDDLYFLIQVVSEKIIQFSIFNCGKNKQSTATTLRWLKHNLPVCKKIFKWYHSMVRCKSYGPLSDEW